MNGYVIGGYAVVLVSLGLYAANLVQRLKSARRRVENQALDASTPGASDLRRSGGKRSG